jgi:hypothetical protein
MSGKKPILVYATGLVVIIRVEPKVLPRRVKRADAFADALFMSSDSPSQTETDRRAASDRRASTDRRNTVVDRRSGMDRRRGPGRRRGEVRRAAEEGEISGELLEFIMAIDEYKRVNDRPFPSWSEVFEIVHYLGYRKVADRAKHINSASSNVLDTPHQNACGND